MNGNSVTRLQPAPTVTVPRWIWRPLLGAALGASFLAGLGVGVGAMLAALVYTERHASPPTIPPADPQKPHAGRSK